MFLMVSLGLLRAENESQIEKAESNKNNQEFDEIIRGIETKFCLLMFQFLFRRHLPFFGILSEKRKIENQMSAVL